MNYIKIDFEKVKGFDKLTERAKELFEQTYKVHNTGQGTEYKEGWIPTMVKEHKQFLELHFKNGEWLHYYANGTWG